jgi:hypothetical protein
LNQNSPTQPKQEGQEGQEEMLIVMILSLPSSAGLALKCNTPNRGQKKAK